MITLTGINNRPHCGQPPHSLAHALLSGGVIAAFVVVGAVWLMGMA